MHYTKSILACANYQILQKIQTNKSYKIKLPNQTKNQLPNPGEKY